MGVTGYGILQYYLNIYEKDTGKSLTDTYGSVSYTHLDVYKRQHVDCVKLTPDQKFLCAVDNGLDQVKIYRVDYEYGKLELVDKMCIRDRT